MRNKLKIKELSLNKQFKKLSSDFNSISSLFRDLLVFLHKTVGFAPKNFDSFE